MILQNLLLDLKVVGKLECLDPALELKPEEQLFELHSRLSGVQAQQKAITRQIAELEEQSPEASVISEAESVARADAKRNASRR